MAFVNLHQSESTIHFFLKEFQWAEKQQCKKKQHDKDEEFLATFECGLHVFMMHDEENSIEPDRLFLCAASEEREINASRSLFFFQGSKAETEHRKRPLLFSVQAGEN